MKKRLLSLALTLALCLGLAIPAFAADTSGLDANTRKAYYDILTAEINKYGIVSANGKKGVEYAALEDMDADGTPELIVICFPEDNAYDACIFVWKMRNGKAVQTVNETSIYPGGAVSEANVFLVRQPGKTAVCHYFSYFYRDWLLDEQGNPPAPTYNLYYVDGTVETVESIDEAWKEDDMKVFGGDGYWWHEEKATEAVMQLRSDLAKAPVSGGFTDVKAGAYYADAVKWAVDRKITSGTSATTFSPDQTCTVAQILTFLWNANGQPEPTVRNPFSNVSSNNYYWKAVVWAYEKGLIPGAGYFYNENVPCTRSMAAYFLWKLAGAPTSAPSAQYTAQNITVIDGEGYEYYLKFDAAILEETTITKEVPVYADDGPYIADWRDERAKVTLITMRPGSTVTVSNTLPSDWDMDNIILDYYGYTIGGNSKYHDMALQFPLSVCTGAVENTFQYSEGSMHELADLTAMELKNKGDNTHGSYMLQMAPTQTKFSDVPAHAFYAQAVAWAVENGVTAGTSDTTFSPGDTCTRGQIVTFLHRAMG